jgi:hypothetical protein
MPSIPTGDAFGRGARLTAEQRLAAAVLARAVKDARNPKLPESTRRNATAFLAGHGALDFWCAIWGVSADSVRARVRRSSESCTTELSADVAKN